CPHSLDSLLPRQRRAFGGTRANGTDVSDETVSLAGYCLDVLPSGFPVSERLAQDREVVRQVALFDDGVRPNVRQQFLLAHQPAVIFDQHPKRVEYFRPQRHRMAMMQQSPLPNVKPERAELVNGAGALRCHPLASLIEGNTIMPSLLHQR